MTTADVQAPFVPPHVPPELITTFNIYDPAYGTDPFASMAALLKVLPRVSWTTHDMSGFQPGAWVIGHADDVRYVLQNPTLFSSDGIAGFSRLIGEDWLLTPLEMDAPRHTQWRQIVNPLFTPLKMQELDDSIRAWALDLVNAVREQDGCDFMKAFGTPFPIGVFLRLLGLPVDMMPQFLIWENELLHSDDISTTIKAVRQVRDYMWREIEARRKEPKDDLISWAVQAKIKDEPLPDREILGFCMLMYIGGLDTVAASLGFYWKHLAENQQNQARIRNEPQILNNAVEELLRAHPVVTTHRRATQDVEIGGVTVKAGDWLMVLTSPAGRDPAAFPNPDEVDFDRANKTNVTFSLGPHRCLGSNLARREIKIALEVWAKELPQFRLKAGTRPKMHAGGVLGVDELQIAWD